MAYARISMTESNSAEELDAGEEAYKLIRDEAFPGIQMTGNVRTGRKSLLSFSIYPDQETCEATLAGQKKQIDNRNYVKDSFFMKAKFLFGKLIECTVKDLWLNITGRI